MDEGVNINRTLRCEWCGKRLGTAWAWEERVRSHGYEWDARFCSINCHKRQEAWKARNTFETSA